MYCSNCGKEINEAYLYCSNCGSKIDIVEIQRAKNYNDQVYQPKLDLYVSAYNPITKQSIIVFLCSVFLTILALLPINMLYLLGVLQVSVALLVLSIVFYKKRKDKMLFVSCIINAASIYTILGWMYYLLVK